MFPHFHVLQFHVLQNGPSFSRPAFSVNPALSATKQQTGLCNLCLRKCRASTTNTSKAPKIPQKRPALNNDKQTIGAELSLLSCLPYKTAKKDVMASVSHSHTNQGVYKINQGNFQEITRKFHEGF